MNNRDSHSTINFYGERGIVNSIVLFLAQNDNNLKGFLNSIRFINNKQCFCNINENISITDIHYWVELSLSQFGNPDLIIDFKMNDKTHILFIEAKLTDFIKASSKGIIDFKDSSLLNIQLLLKERFVQALNNEKNNGKDRTRIEEKDIKETDLKREKRALGKQSILEKIKYFNKDCIFYYIGLVTNKDTEIDALDEKIKQLMPSENVDNLNIGIINYNNIAEMINERNDVYTQMFNFAWEITGMKTDNNYYTEGDNGSLFDDNTDLISFLDEAIIEIRKKQKINFIKTENTESWSYRYTYKDNTDSVKSSVVFKIFKSQCLEIGINNNSKLGLKLEEIPKFNKDYKINGNTFKCYLIENTKDLIILVNSIAKQIKENNI